MTYETKYITFSRNTCESAQRLLMFKNFTYLMSHLRVHNMIVLRLYKREREIIRVYGLG